MRPHPPSSMNELIELHDSELAAVSVRGGEIVVTLAPAYLHRSRGRPGIDAGSGWVQPATLSFGEATLSGRSAPANLPATVSEGELRVGLEIYSNLIPTSGKWEGAIAFSLVPVTGEALVLRARRLWIQLHGEASFVENYEA